MSLSRKEFCQKANTNSDRFCSKLSATEIFDTSVLCLTTTNWDQHKVIQFCTICRLLLNFAIKRIIMVIDNTQFNVTSNNIIETITNDPTFMSISRIKQPKSAIIIDCISQKHLKLHPHHLLNRFSVSDIDHNKLQIIIIPIHSVSFASLSPSSNYTNYHQSFIYHNLCNNNSLQSQLIAIKALNDSLHNTQNSDTFSHFFHIKLDEEPINWQKRLSLISFLTFTVYSYRRNIPLFDQMNIEMKQNNEDDVTDCMNKGTICKSTYASVPVLFEWKDPYNIGRMIHLSEMFKISVFIHLFDHDKLNLYRNNSFISKISQCCAKNVDEWRSMVQIKVVNNEAIALKLINNGCDEGDDKKVCILIMNQELFLKVLNMDQERSLLIMETVNFGNKTSPISLNQFIKKGKIGNSLKWYGIVGRENYGIKPKYLYDLYKIYNDAEKKMKVVFVETSKILPSLNACTAISLLIWATYCISSQQLHLI